MAEKRYGVGDVIRGDHVVLSVHEGFLGIVYLCRQSLPRGKAVYKAIKTFRHRDDALNRRLFEAELSYWTQLPAHPNVVQARDADTTNMFLVLEFIPGPNLRDVAYRSPVHPRHFLQWARQIAAGLRFLHVENHFLHRDLRPANVLVDTAHGLTAKITDLGIGKPFNPTATSHTVIGTYTYMAPEVHEGRTDYRSDIFSFGALLYYLLTGRDAVKLTTKNLSHVASPHEVVPEAPASLAELIVHCLEPKPERRAHSIVEVAPRLDTMGEWPVNERLYRACWVHDFSYFVDGPGEGCPFCRYEKDLRQSEEWLEQVLRQRRG